MIADFRSSHVIGHAHGLTRDGQPTEVEGLRHQRRITDREQEALLRVGERHVKVYDAPHVSAVQSSDVDALRMVGAGDAEEHVRAVGQQLRELVPELLGRQRSHGGRGSPCRWHSVQRRDLCGREENGAIVVPGPSTRVRGIRKPQGCPAIQI